MQPQEILPSPEKKNKPQNLEAKDNSNEVDMAMQLEQKVGSPQGSAAITGVAVDDAQGAVQGLQGDPQGSAQPHDDTHVEVPDIAEDIDLIEKEWVRKAKEIVQQTTGDPYVQNKQINKMKVEYIKKRYGKDVKQGEEQ